MKNTNELFEQIKLKKIDVKNQNKTQKNIKVYGAQERFETQIGTYHIIYTTFTRLLLKGSRLLFAILRNVILRKTTVVLHNDYFVRRLERSRCGSWVRACSSLLRTFFVNVNKNSRGDYQILIK